MRHLSGVLAAECPLCVGLPELTGRFEIIPRTALRGSGNLLLCFLRTCGHEDAFSPSHVRHDIISSNNPILAEHMGLRMFPLNSVTRESWQFFLHFGSQLSGLRQQPDGRHFSGGRLSRPETPILLPPAQNTDARVSARLGLDSCGGRPPDNKNARRRRAESSPDCFLMATFTNGACRLPIITSRCIRPLQNFFCWRTDTPLPGFQQCRSFI